MKFKNENQNQNSELKSKIENENQESNLKIENEKQNSNLKFDYQTVILWLIANHKVLDALKDLQNYILGDYKEQKYDIANYRQTLILISKITNDNTIKDIVDDTLSGK